MMIMKQSAAAAAALAMTLSLSPAAWASGHPAPAAAVPQVLPIGVAVSALPLATEDRTGYQRTSFRHWNAGDVPADGCNTRAEVLLAEAVVYPEIGPGCTLTGGVWWSYYDEREVTPAGALDIDHMVPLAEAWDSGASSWTAQRREAYANDQGQSASLVAVTARSNRSKADQDPAEWLPPSPDALCRYGAEWTATKLRWGLAVDEMELDRLLDIAAGCGGTDVEFAPAL
ncbi:HNH endonuclease family protein [Streptomyces sp. MB09-01]|uniref:HNH endonuclease family protein n=1 Tax=Streptomyces sp. MB09-01 TaxID=3028666 RepID=UPI0029B697AE|nr:HNH endonuclease family protein [Streptomyces sp. MB09-01]MDX3540608.1 HNH endonuclease family protein [Streptomyces sp. MB09-01]